MTTVTVVASSFFFFCKILQSTIWKLQVVCVERMGVDHIELSQGIMKVKPNSASGDDPVLHG